MSCNNPESPLRKLFTDQRNSPVSQLMRSQPQVREIQELALTRDAGDKRYVDRAGLPSTIGQNSNQVDHGQLQGLGDDDHSQYHNDTRGDARYVRLSTLTTKGDIFARSSTAPARVAVGSNGQVLTADSTASAGVSWQTPAAGVTDHGALSGLADDDHSQYHNDTRGDARYYKKTEFSSNPGTSSSIPLHTGSGGLLTLDKLYLGSSSGDSNFAAAVDLQAIDKDIGVSRNSGNAAYVAHSYGGNFATFIGRSAGGTRASPSNTSSGTEIVRFGGAGYGSGFPTTSAAYMSIVANQAQTSGNKGTRIEWYTTPDGSSTAARRMRLAADGKLAVNGTHDPGSALDVDGTIVTRNGGDVRADGGIRSGNTTGDAPTGSVVMEQITTPAAQTGALVIYWDGTNFKAREPGGTTRTITWT